MQPQLSIQGYGGDFLIQPVVDHYYQQQNVSPGSSGIPSPPESCSMYQMGVTPMQLQQHAGDYPPMQAMSMSPMFTPHHLGLGPGHHSLRQRDFLRCRRKMDLARMGFKSHPTAVARRNERERNRVKHINGTFTTLRQHLPSGAKNKKMSKVETLRSAIRYISHLQQILTAQDEEDSKSDGDAVQSPHSTSAIDCSDADTSKTTKAENSIEDSSRRASCSSESSAETASADSSCSPDSGSRPCSLGSHKHSAVNSQGKNTMISPQTPTTLPTSPSSSAKSLDSPIPSGYSSSDDPNYDAFATTEDDIAELVDWLEWSNKSRSEGTKCKWKQTPENLMIVNTNLFVVPTQPKR